jgi:hypothetical protein
MANYYATARSNYFRVKNAAAFRAWCRKRRLGVWSRDADDGAGKRYAIYPIYSGDGGWSTYDAETGDAFDVFAELAPHLHPKDVAVLIEIGSEKLRYLIGIAVAIHPSGRMDRVSLDDIYRRAMQDAEEGVTVTEAAY